MVVKAELHFRDRKFYTFTPKVGRVFKERGDDDGYMAYKLSDDKFKRTRIIDGKQVGVSEEWEKARVERESKGLPPRETLLVEDQINDIRIPTVLPGVSFVLRYEQD